jgi:hypothetical protein
MDFTDEPRMSRRAYMMREEEEMERMRHRDMDPGNSPLHAAVMKDNHETVALLCDKGSDVHSKNSSGRTPLSLCAVYNSKLSAKVV